MSATQNEKAMRLRALHNGPGAFVIPNPWDVGIRADPCRAWIQSIGYLERGIGLCSGSVDTYGHLIPGANVSFVDRLDSTPEANAETNWQRSATPAQLAEVDETAALPELIDLIGGGAWTRTTDLRIMRPSL